MSDSRAYGDNPELAELYDLFPQYTSRPDKAFYLDVCRRTPEAVLELGCGTGRVLAEVAAAGMHAVGVDSSPHMLQRFRRRLAGLSGDTQGRRRLVQGDMTSFQLDETFGTVLIPFRPFQHLLSVGDQLSCLRRVHEHLSPGGLLAFDVFHPHLGTLAGGPQLEETEELPWTPVQDGRSVRRCSRIPGRHRAQQTFDVELIYYVRERDGTTRRLIHAFTFRYFFRYEMQHLLTLSGFEVVGLYGDFTGAALSDDSPEMIFVARK